MPNQIRDSHPSSRRLSLWRTPLFRLLAINLAIGIMLAIFLVGGLLWLDPGGLRHLILADRSPATALGLLLFGFIVTLGSTAMGTAIMAMGRSEGEDDEPGGLGRMVRQEVGRGVQWGRSKADTPMSCERLQKHASREAGHLRRRRGHETAVPGKVSHDKRSG